MWERLKLDIQNNHCKFIFTKGFSGTLSNVFTNHPWLYVSTRVTKSWRNMEQYETNKKVSWSLNVQNSASFFALHRGHISVLKLEVLHLKMFKTVTLLPWIQKKNALILKVLTVMMTYSPWQHSMSGKIINLLLVYFMFKSDTFLVARSTIFLHNCLGWFYLEELPNVGRDIYVTTQDVQKISGAVVKI